MIFKSLTYICVSVTILSSASAQFLDEYGRPKYIAARKGDPPPCEISPGETFCEHVKNYPYDTILHAIRNTHFDITRLLVDESTDEGPNYGYVSTPQTLSGDPNRSTNPLPPLRDLSTDMRPPPPTKDVRFSENHLEEKEYDDPYESQFDLTIEDIQKRFERIPRDSSFSDKDNLKYNENKTISRPTRIKRQDLNGLQPGPPLCRYTSKYVLLQSAMCASTGDWMYVVNVNMVSNRLSQMIKTEVCDKGVDGRPCMGDCGESNLPFGVVSRCEQHYIQRRLITLSLTGRQIITEMFWLPTCCVCRTFRTPQGSAAP